MKYEVRLSDQATHYLELPSLVPGVPVEVNLDGQTVSVRLVEQSANRIQIEVGGHVYRFETQESPGTRLTLLHNNRPYRLDVRSELEEVSRKARVTQGGPVTIQSQLPGVVRQVFVQAGDTVETGEALLTLEAMKMENEIRAESASKVEKVLVEAGQVVAAREDLVRLVPV